MGAARCGVFLTLGFLREIENSMSLRFNGQRTLGDVCRGPGYTIGTGPVTLFAWQNADSGNFGGAASPNQYGYILAHGNGGDYFNNNGSGPFLRMFLGVYAGSGVPQALNFFVPGSTTNGNWTTGSGQITYGTWKSVGATYDFSSLSTAPKLYVKGVSQSVTTFSSPNNIRGPMGETSGLGRLEILKGPVRRGGRGSAISPMPPCGPENFRTPKLRTCTPMDPSRIPWASSSIFGPSSSTLRRSTSVPIGSPFNSPET